MFIAATSAHVLTESPATKYLVNVNVIPDSLGLVALSVRHFFELN